MKRLSIKLRVTLWFTLFTTLSAVACLIFMFAVGEKTVYTNFENNLVSAVEACFDEIEYDDGELDIDDDIEAYKDNVYIAIYDSNDGLLYGRTPSGFAAETEVTAQTMQKVDGVDNDWYVYDAVQRIEGREEVRVRGIASAASAGNTFSILHGIALIVFPFFAVIAAVGGYVIIKRAFLPVRKISETAERISENSDLSQRIALCDGNDSKDEIYALSSVFDHMFDRLQEAFENEKQFTSDASHELRTPTSVIISQCEFALENAQSLDEAKDALYSCLSQAKKMSGLISQLLTLARTDKGQQRLSIELVNISELASVICEQQSEKAKLRKIKLQTDIQPNLLLRGDETMLMRMLINLIDNGINYGNIGGRLDFSLKSDGKAITGKVNDDGIGIAPENIDKIWERFFREDYARNPNQDNAGLGLSMVKWIVEAHGGKITVESIQGEGSTFTFSLPVSE